MSIKNNFKRVILKKNVDQPARLGDLGLPRRPPRSRVMMMVMVVMVMMMTVVRRAGPLLVAIRLVLLLFLFLVRVILLVSAVLVVLLVQSVLGRLPEILETVLRGLTALVVFHGSCYAAAIAVGRAHRNPVRNFAVVGKTRELAGRTRRIGQPEGLALGSTRSTHSVLPAVWPLMPRFWL